MNKISKRLLSIADFVSKEDELVDVGCDHGLLSIYLIHNQLCERVIASDINQNALNNAINNIKKSNLDIETVLSDGIKDVNLKNINSLIISGMGASTIEHILSDHAKLKNIDKIIIQSNNDHEKLRTYMNNINYYLQEEKILKDHNKWYITMLFIKSDKKNSNNELKYGYLNNSEYKDYLIKEYEKINSLIPETSKDDKQKIINKIDEIKKIIKGE